jgi:transcriptional regulator with XRE-family HTH domain
MHPCRMTVLPEFSAFLRSRREVLRPEDVGLTAGSRRRVPGLRRDEVALLAKMSSNYYERLERGSGPRPSAALLAALARALRLTADERDYLYTLAGQLPPPPNGGDGYVDPGLMHVMDALAATTPAFVSDDLSNVLVQNCLNVALLGELAGRPGRESNFLWRWFMDLDWRDAVYEKTQQPELGRIYASSLRAALARRKNDAASSRLLAELRAGSKEFRTVWDEYYVNVLRTTRKLFINEEVGLLQMECDVALGLAGGRQRLVLFRPEPGTDTRARLEKLSALLPGFQDR